MQYSKVSDLPIIEESDAKGEVAQIYADYKREMEIHFVPNILRGLAISPAALAIHWDFTRSIYQHATLPQFLISMIRYAIAESKNCQYCSVGNELTCRSLGIDAETMSALVEDLQSVSPARIQAIIAFALKVSHDPQGLLAEDYERVREHGVTDDELVEIILIASIANYADTLADALKIDVEPGVSQALSQYDGIPR